MDSTVESNMGIKFGLIFFSSSEAPFSGDKYRLVIESARYVDLHGFSSIWIPERHFTKDGWLYPNPAILQAALARETSQIQLRAGSVVVPLHDPIRIAEEWAMVDNLSNGRVGLSFASGWHPNDFVFFPENYEKRHEVMYRGIETVRKLWRGETIQVKGVNGQPVDVRTYPTPIQAELPFWVTAAGNPKTFAGAGEIGAHLLTHLFNQSIEDLAEKIQVYRNARAQHGFDPQTGQVSVMLHTFVGEDAGLVREQVLGPFSNYLKSGAYLVDAIGYSRGQKVDIGSLSEQDLNDYLQFVLERLISTQRVLFGVPESCLDMILRLKAAGVDEIACQLDFGIDLQVALDSLPALNRLKELSASALVQMPPGAGVYEVRGHSSSTANDGHTPVQTATVVPPVSVKQSNQLVDIQRRCAEEVSIADFYQRLHERGIQLNSRFQGIERLWRRDGEAIGYVRLSEQLKREAADYQVHPTLLDSCFQVLIASLPRAAQHEDDALYLPTGIRGFRLRKRPHGQVWSHAVLTAQPDEAEGLFVGDVFVLDEDGEVLIEASGLQLQRSELASGPTAQAESLKDWLYELRWEPVALQKASSQVAQPRGKWLIFADRDGVGHELAQLLAARGELCSIVVPGEGYATVEPDVYQVNAARADEVQRVIREVINADPMPLHGIIHLWSLNTTAPEQTSAASLQADQVLGTGSALHIIQSLLHLEQSQSPRLWLVTRGAQPVGEEHSALAVAQAPLWGLGKTCAMEQPELWGGMIDIDPQMSSTATAQQLLTALDGSQVEQAREDLLAFRKDQAFASRMVRSRDWTPRALKIRQDASYLITGGLWGLGLEVAHWLVKKGARHLVLLGRTKLPARDQWAAVAPGSRLALQLASLRGLEETGAQVDYAAVDVADECQLSDFLQNFERQGHPPVRGVMHAASVWQDAQGQSLVRPLANLDGAALQAVFNPKVLGGWLLHTLLKDRPLDFFVSFSSGASLFGSVAQGNYAAAGEFLDVLAYQMRAQGQSAISIDWGAISETGFGATNEGLRVHEYWETRGIQRITPAQVLDALELLIPQQAARVGVLKLDWQLLRASYAQISSIPLLKYLVAETSAGGEKAATGDAPESETLPQLLAADQAERLSLVITYLSEQVARVLRVPAARLDIEQPLTALGLDSLMAIELKNHIERELKVRIPIVAFLQGPSIVQFAGQILEQIHTEAQQAQAAQNHVGDAEGQITHAGDVDAERLLAQLDRLSDSEVDQLLNQMLQEGTSQDNVIGELSVQAPELLLERLDQLSDDAIDSLLSEMVQKEE